MNLTPAEIVRELSKHIVGQEAAKRAVAVALRNRYRRKKLPPEIARGIGQAAREFRKGIQEEEKKEEPKA